MDAFDLGFSSTPIKPTFIPYLVSNEHADKVLCGLPEPLKESVRRALADGWRFYAVKQNKGCCYYRHKVITIPIYAIESKRPGERIYYVAHETAHIFTRGDQHGPKFMAKLMEICPPEYLHYEIEYKPRNAIAAGISRPGTVKVKTITVGKITLADL